MPINSLNTLDGLSPEEAWLVKEVQNQINAWCRTLLLIEAGQWSAANRAFPETLDHFFVLRMKRRADEATEQLIASAPPDILEAIRWIANERIGPVEKEPTYDDKAWEALRPGIQRWAEGAKMAAKLAEKRKSTLKEGATA